MRGGEAPDAGAIELKDGANENDKVDRGSVVRAGAGTAMGCGGAVEG